MKIAKGRSKILSSRSDLLGVRWRLNATRAQMLDNEGTLNTANQSYLSQGLDLNYPDG